MYNNSVNSIKERCVILGKYLVETRSTVRAAASEFGISKSTVHKDLTQRLETCSRSLYLQMPGIHTGTDPSECGSDYRSKNP